MIPGIAPAIRKKSALLEPMEVQWLSVLNTPGFSTDTFTFTSVGLGSPAVGRHILVSINAWTGNPISLDGVTVGGVSATMLTSLPSDGIRTGFAIAHVPIGSSGDIVVAWGGAVSTCFIAVWRIDNINSIVPVVSPHVTQGVSPLSGSQVAHAGGCVFGSAAVLGNSSMSWTGLSERYDAAGNSVTRSGADSGVLLSGGTVDVTAADDFGSANTCLALVSLR